MIMGLLDSPAFRQGLSFAVVSSSMTVIGLSAGIWLSGGRIETMLAAIIGLAVSNSFADAFSIYMANLATGDVEMALTSALVTGTIELILPFLFILPLLFLDVKRAVLVNIVFGACLVAGMGYYVALLNHLDHIKMLQRVGIYVAVFIITILSAGFSGKFTRLLAPYVKRINRASTV